MDYIKYTKYKKHINWENFRTWSLEKKYRLILLTTKSRISYINYNFRKNDILLFGRESAGVPEIVHKKVNKRLLIPMVKGFRSINLSSSVAMVVGEACRQLNLF